jgi:hypothetical protein
MKKETLLALVILALSIVIATAAIMFFQSPMKGEKQTATEQALAFIKDVARIDLSKYNVSLTGHNLRNDQHGGVPTEMFKYTLNSDASKLHAIIDFINGTFSSYILYIDEGVPFYNNAPSTIVNDAIGTLDRFQHISGSFFPNEMVGLLDSVNPSTNSTTLELSTLKLIAHIQGNNASIICFYVENGIDYVRKGVSLTFENGNLKAFGADYDIFAVGNTIPTVSREKALETAVGAVENYKLNITLGPNNTVQPSFSIDTDNMEIELAPAEREPLTLQLLWTTQIHLKEPVYRTYAFVVSQWADMDEIKYISPISGGSSLVGS